MAQMNKPITITRCTSLSKNWMRIVGFLTLWLEEEIGFRCCHHTFNRDILFRATAAPGDHLYEFIYKGPKGEERKTMSARLYDCLMHYSCMRSWRLPKNTNFLVGLSGQPFIVKEIKRCVPKLV